MTTSSDKNEPMALELDFEDALRQTRNGFKARRKDWHVDDYVIWADSGSFRQNKVIMGDLEPFAVRHYDDGKLRIFYPSTADMNATDWTVSV